MAEAQKIKTQNYGNGAPVMANATTFFEIRHNKKA
jgi:hypothetical protein